MEAKRKLELYREGLELTEKMIELDTENMKNYGPAPFTEKEFSDFIEKLKSNSEWYKEQIAILEPIVKAEIAEIYKDVETLDRLLEIDEKGVFWLYTVEPGGKPSLDECLGRNDDKYTLAIIPKELHTLTHQEPPVRVKVVKEKAEPGKRRKVTKKVFIDADYFINHLKH